jgi:ABC-type amino acid transport substrate-binding protein
VGVTNAPMFSESVEGQYQGIDIDFAKGVAAALYDGDVSRIRYVVVSAEERFSKLQNGEVDMLARVTTNTPERDVKEKSTGKGCTFSTPYFHDSVRMVGRTLS